jgi:fructokinase
MGDPRVLCLGEVLFDCLADQRGRSFDEVESWTPLPGGAPANVACGLVKLGTSAGFMGTIGCDTQGNELLNFLETEGVNTQGVQRHDTAPTRQVYVLRSETGDRDFAGFGEYATTEFADTYLNALQIPTSLFIPSEFLVLGTLGLAYPHSRDAIGRALLLAEQYHLKVLLDINWRKPFWEHPFWANEEDIKPPILGLSKKVDFVKLSKEEALWLFGTTDAGAIAYHLGSVEGVFVTDGENGCSYCLSEHEGTIRGFPVEVVDTTGAGDAFVAGFIHQLCQQGMKCLQTPERVKQVVEYASAVGALTTTKLGAIASLPTADEVEAFLRTHKRQE